MALTQLAPPYPIFTDKSGSPLDNGYLYFGEVNKNPETNPIQVYYDSAFTQPAAQPLRTSNGYVMRNGSPALIYAGSQFSVTVRDKNNALVIYSPVGYGIDPGSVTGTVVYDDFTGDGATVNFTLSASPSTKNATNVYIDGVYQSKDNYSTSGSTLTFSTAPPLNSAIEVVTQESSIIGGASSQQITYTQGGAGAVTRTVQSRLRDFVSVKDFGAVGDGVTDDTAAIQAAIDSHRGKIFLPTGTYKISSTIILKNETILIGEGAGAYFQGGGYPRLTVLQPAASFTGNDVLRADPADDSPLLSYRYGVALRDLLIDCINIKNLGKNILKLYSLSNTETFDSVRIINNNANIAIRIGISANASALESDGLSFNNIYCLQTDSGGSATNPVLLIESANEVSFRDSKFQRGSDPTTVGSKAVHINASTGRAVNAVTFDSCSFTGAETGLLVQGKNTDGQGPRWIRAQNCTFEGPKFPIFAIGESLRPVQFCTFGSGNRMIALAAGGTGVVLSANANNNIVEADEFTTVLFDTFSAGNTLIGGNSLTNNGTNNVRINRNANAVQVNNSFIENWTDVVPSAGWSNGSPTNRTLLGYRKDSFGRVHLKGYLSGGSWGSPNYVMTLPVGYRPPAARTQELTASGDGVVVRVVVTDAGEVFGVGSGSLLLLDGVSFPTN